MVGARDHGLTCFERLAKSVEHVRLELGQLTQEEHTVMGERDFPRMRS